MAQSKEFNLNSRDAGVQKVMADPKTTREVRIAAVYADAERHIRKLERIQKMCSAVIAALSITAVVLLLAGVIHL